MANDHNRTSPDEFQMMWAELPRVPAMTAEQVREYARQVTTGLRRRRVIAAIVLVLGIGNAVLSALLQPRPLAPWQWVVAIFLVGWVIVMLWLTRASRRRWNPSLDSVESVRSYRTMLEKERDMNQGRQLASRLVIPAIGAVVASSVLYRTSGLSETGVLIVTALAGVATAWLWLRAAQRARLFEEHLDLLDKSVSD